MAVLQAPSQKQNKNYTVGTNEKRRDWPQVHMGRKRVGKNAVRAESMRYLAGLESVPTGTRVTVAACAGPRQEVLEGERQESLERRRCLQPSGGDHAEEERFIVDEKRVAAGCCAYDAIERGGLM